MESLIIGSSGEEFERTENNLARRRAAFKQCLVMPSQTTSRICVFVSGVKKNAAGIALGLMNDLTKKGNGTDPGKRGSRHRQRYDRRQSSDVGSSDSRSV